MYCKTCGHLLASHAQESPHMIVGVMFLAIGTFCFFLALGYWLAPLFTH